LIVKEEDKVIPKPVPRLEDDGMDGGYRIR